jgi:hypothetical protein
MDDAPKAKRTPALSPSSWSTLYSNSTTTQLLLTNEQKMSKNFCSPLSIFPLLYQQNLCHGDAHFFQYLLLNPIFLQTPQE